MAESISNKTLVVLLVIAIGVSVMGIWVSLSKQSVVLTGASTSQIGTVQLRVSEFVGISINNNSIDFGNITLTQGLINCTLNSSQSTDPLNLTGNVSQPSPVVNYTCLPADPGCICNGSSTFAPSFFEIQNDGNVRINLSIQSAMNASAFFGGSTLSQQKYYAYAGEANSCVSGLQNTPVALTTSSTQACGCMSATDANDTVRTELIEIIASDATAGLHNQSITFTAVSNSACT